MKSILIALLALNASFATAAEDVKYYTCSNDDATVKVESSTFVSIIVHNDDAARSFESFCTNCEMSIRNSIAQGYRFDGQYQNADFSLFVSGQSEPNVYYGGGKYANVGLIYSIHYLVDAKIDTSGLSITLTHKNTGASMTREFAGCKESATPTLGFGS